MNDWFADWKELNKKMSTLDAISARNAESSALPSPINLRHQLDFAVQSLAPVRPFVRSLRTCNSLYLSLSRIMPGHVTRHKVAINILTTSRNSNLLLRFRRHLQAACTSQHFWLGGMTGVERCGIFTQVSQRYEQSLGVKVPGPVDCGGGRGPGVRDDNTKLPRLAVSRAALCENCACNLWRSIRRVSLLCSLHTTPAYRSGNGFCENRLCQSAFIVKWYIAGV